MTIGPASTSRPEWIEPPVVAALPPLHADPLIHRLLAGRLGDEAAATEFLDARPRPAPDPELLPGMTAAAERVAQALATGEMIALYGDYDVDGVTSVVVLAEALRAASGGAAPSLLRLPTRAEGYGVHPRAVDEIADAGVRLLISVDCGSSDDESIALARSRGIDVVVLDHHQMAGTGPAGAIVASAQVDPAAGAAYRDLTAAGVAYLLAVALARRGFDVGRGPGREPVGLLDLVALGTVADVAPLTGVNRRFVRDGLRRLAESPRPGLAALCRQAGIAPAAVGSEAIAFKLAPRLNAAGRMADPRLALDLLHAAEPLEAERLAIELEGLNRRRRSEAARVLAEAERDLQLLPATTTERVLVLTRPNWGNGVLGLAAAKLVERWGRPVVILSDEAGTSRGSARSVPGFDIARAFAGCGELLRSHGGHSLAAGVSLATTDVPRLTEALAAAVAAEALPPPGPPTLQIDADLPAERLQLATAELLETLQPFGTGNPAPLLRVRGVEIRSYATIGRDASHLTLKLRTPRGVVRAVSWGNAGRSRELVRQRRLDLLATIGIDHWNGQRRLQVEIKDWRPAD